MFLYFLFISNIARLKLIENLPTPQKFYQVKWRQTWKIDANKKLKLFKKHSLKQSLKIALRQGCSPVNLLHFCRTPFPKTTSGELLLIRKGLGDLILVQIFIWRFNSEKKLDLVVETASVFSLQLKDCEER